MLDNPIPRPVPADQLSCDTTKPYHSDDTCYPLRKTSENGWSLSDVFGRTLNGLCPIADGQRPGSETICLRVPHDRDVQITPGASERKYHDGLLRCFSLQSSKPFDLTLPEQETHSHVPLDESVLQVERTIIGHGQENGGMRIIFGNPSNTNHADFVYFETLPWFLRPYIHTLQTTLTGRDGIRRRIPASEIIKETFYRPAIDRERGTQLELALSVPAASTVTLIYDFDKAILRYMEYPPDANRGFNVAPAVVRLLNSPKTNDVLESPIYIRTTGLLLPLPTPDFSMPYNVIILTSTVIALAFGSIFNILIRRFVAADEAGVLVAHTIRGRLSNAIIAVKSRLSSAVIAVQGRILKKAEKVD